ncbi:nucleotidyltransferase family protein [Virgibacillus sp. Bac330]|uniref:nucleotidyltransferase family protein n=1 Tax=Virgibacillus sp. Bac330 TaxID=2419841 RepID=UPI000EF4AD04|nr:nucleotidyltransferase family protein [Virgibacillus sp. Bac330]
MLNKDFIRFLLIGEKISQKPFHLSQKDFIPLIKTKLFGFVSEFVNTQEVTFDDKLINLFEDSIMINKIRNINLINTSIDLDNTLETNNINRLWIKGISDLYNTPDYINLRKLSDVDILVEKNQCSFVREILLQNGFQHGAYSNQGEWVTAKEEEILEMEKKHYELFPLSKMVHIPNLDAFNFNKNLLTTFRIRSKDNIFFTDYCIDVHHGLTFDLDTSWMLGKGRFPRMERIDEIWYFINKVYHEIIIGESINLQLFLITLKIIRESGIEKRDIINRLYKTGYTNTTPIELIYSIAYKEITSEEIDTIVEKIESKI